MVDPIKQLPALPVERALKVISGRWKAIILYRLFDGPQRFSDLMRQMPDISQKVLIQQLREMQEHGLVHREVFRQVPARVDYSATPLGLSFEPVLLALCDWGRQHAVELDELDRLADCPMNGSQAPEHAQALASSGMRPVQYPRRAAVPSERGHVQVLDAQQRLTSR